MPRLVPSFSSFPKTQPVQGYKHFLTPLRKLIFDYDAEAPSQHGIRYVLSPPPCLNLPSDENAGFGHGKQYALTQMNRSYIRKPLLDMARENPDVEIVVRRLKRGKAAVLRGHYGGYFYHYIWRSVFVESVFAD